MHAVWGIQTRFLMLVQLVPLLTVSPEPSDRMSTFLKIAGLFFFFQETLTSAIKAFN